LGPGEARHRLSRSASIYFTACLLHARILHAVEQNCFVERRERRSRPQMQRRPHRSAARNFARRAFPLCQLVIFRFLLSGSLSRPVSIRVTQPEGGRLLLFERAKDSLLGEAPVEHAARFTDSIRPDVRRLERLITRQADSLSTNGRTGETKPVALTNRLATP